MAKIKDYIQAKARNIKNSYNRTVPYAGQVMRGIGRDMSQGYRDLKPNLRLMTGSDQDKQKFSQGWESKMGSNGLGRRLSKATEGIYEGTTWGALDVPLRASENLGDRLSYGAGYMGGYMVSPLTKLAGVTNKLLQKAKPVNQIMTKSKALQKSGNAFARAGGRGIQNLTEGVPYTLFEAGINALNPNYGKEQIGQNMASDFGMAAIPKIGKFFVNSPNVNTGIKNNAEATEIKRNIKQLYRQLSDATEKGQKNRIKSIIKEIKRSTKAFYDAGGKGSANAGIVANNMPKVSQVDTPKIDRTQLTGEQLSTPNAKLNVNNKSVFEKPEVKSAIKETAKGMDVKKKVHILNIASTPENVLRKIGLGKQMDFLRRSYENYKKEVKQEVGPDGRLSQWIKRVPKPGSSRRIFRYLDGQSEILDENEQQVANEIKAYLDQWADRLNIPKEKRITNYITHVFERGKIKKEMDPTFQSKIKDKIAKSVYDPFLDTRYGIEGYEEDVWRALDAYVKRATRKVNMDPALEQINLAAEGFDQSTYKYVKNYIDDVNKRPSNYEDMTDNLIKSMVGYKFTNRPTAYLTQKWRRWIYRGTLGLNIGSAVKNLTQGVNTYAKLGEKYTLLGYTDFLTKAKNNDIKELYDVGVLDDNIIQDQMLRPVKTFMNQVDDVIFAPFQWAEKINRGAAYFGAKKKALTKGLTEEQAVAYAKKIVRETQFTFGDIDTPALFRGNIKKTLFQLLSYPVKQTEFLATMVKNKEVAGLMRYGFASLAVAYTVGDAIGIDWKNFVPFSDGRFKSPTVQLASDLHTLGFGKEEDKPESIANMKKVPFTLLPAGVQGSKTYTGLKAYNQGYSEAPSGRVRYLIEKDAGNLLRTGIFGQYGARESKDYFDNKRKPLSDNQSEIFKQSGDVDYYQRQRDRLDAEKVQKQTEEEMNNPSLIGKLKGMFGVEEAQAGNTLYLEQSNGEIKKIDLDKYQTESTDTIEQIRMERKKFDDAMSIYRNEYLSDTDKESAITKIGAKLEDVKYYDIAADENSEVRRIVVEEMFAQNMNDRKKLLGELMKARREVGGKKILTDTLIDDLYSEGYLTKTEKAILKKVISSKGKLKIKPSASGGGKKKPKVPARGKLNLEKFDIPTIRLQASDNTRPQIFESKPIETGKPITYTPPKFKLDPRIMAGM
jgi:hypothetical protein